VSTDRTDSMAEREARRAAAHAAMARIEQFAAEHRLAEDSTLAVMAAYQERLHHLSDEMADILGWSPARQRSIESRRLRREAVAAERGRHD